MYMNGSISKKMTVRKLFFDDTDTNNIRVCVDCDVIVQLKSKLYFAVSYFGDLRQIKVLTKYKCFIVLLSLDVLVLWFGDWFPFLV